MHLEEAFTAGEGTAGGCPGLQADHRPGWIGPHHSQIQRSTHLQADGGGCQRIQQAHALHRPRQQIHPRRQLHQGLVPRHGLLRHLIEQLLRQSLQAHGRWIGHGQVRVKSKAEGQRRITGRTAMAQTHGDRQRLGFQPQLQLQAEGMGEQVAAGGGVLQAQGYPCVIRQGRQAPHRVTREAMLRQAAAGQTTTDGKEHRDATPHRQGRIRKPFRIEIELLPAVTTPAGHQAAALRHQPQGITVGRGEQPVGIRVRALNQGHAGCRSLLGHGRRANQVSRAWFTASGTSSWGQWPASSTTSVVAAGAWRWN